MACRLSPPCLLHHRQPNAAAPSSSFPRRSFVVASVQSSSSSSTRRGPGSSSSSSTIRVVITEASSAVGRAAIAAVTKARGMAVAGAVDSVSDCVGEDAGELAGLDEPLEVPVLNDLVMVLGSLSQSTTLGVMVDFSSDSARVEENVRQATAFGMKSVVVCGGGTDESGNLDEVVGSLSTFCEKASTGCIVCPTLSIGRILLQQAATAAAFHYGSLKIIESCDPEKFNSTEAIASAPAVPSSEAVSLAMSLSGFGQVYNKGKEAAEEGEEFAVVGDGVRVQTSVMAEPGHSSMEVRLSGPGEALSVKHEIESVSALMPGLLLAIRRVVRLKSLIYGLEKIL